MSYFYTRECMSKERLTVTVDSELIEAANPVTEGRVASLSGWGNLALFRMGPRRGAASALAEAVATLRGFHGTLTFSTRSSDSRP
jgi:hypothetical protein